MCGLVLVESGTFAKEFIFVRAKSAEPESVMKNWWLAVRLRWFLISKTIYQEKINYLHLTQWLRRDTEFS